MKRIYIIKFDIVLLSGRTHTSAWEVHAKSMTAAVSVALARVKADMHDRKVPGRSRWKHYHVDASEA